MKRTIFLDGDNEVVIKKGQGPNRRSRSGTVGQKNGGKYRRSRFPFANIWSKDEFILPHTYV
jgi:hypothetical protein